MCVRPHDATTARPARGYYWPEGCYGDHWCKRRSNICGVFVCQDRFPSFRLCLLSSCQSSRLKLKNKSHDKKFPVSRHKRFQTLANKALECGTNLSCDFLGSSSAACAPPCSREALRLCQSAGNMDSLHWVHASGKLRFWGTI